MAIHVHYICSHVFAVKTAPDRYQGAIRSDKRCPDCQPRSQEQRAEAEANGWHAERLPM